MNITKRLMISATCFLIQDELDKNLSLLFPTFQRVQEFLDGQKTPTLSEMWGISWRYFCAQFSLIMTAV